MGMVDTRNYGSNQTAIRTTLSFHSKITWKTFIAN